MPRPVFFDLDPTIRPVLLEARPDDAHPYDFDPATVRIVRGDQVQRGDVVLGDVFGVDGNRLAQVSYLPYGCIPYRAAPRPMDRTCPCELCFYRTDPYGRLTQPIALTVWQRRALDPVCELVNADELMAIIPAAWAPTHAPISLTTP
ncbi:hypothetical protein [Streptomyces sp. NPDC058657]|uniref:hypothetical protein n=1 Tax=unclassified Streptomyces TaxID=2593676 RepID=UPI00365815B8